MHFGQALQTVKASHTFVRRPTFRAWPITTTCFGMHAISGPCLHWKIQDESEPSAPLPQSFCSSWHLRIWRCSSPLRWARIRCHANARWSGEPHELGLHSCIFGRDGFLRAELLAPVPSRGWHRRGLPLLWIPGRLCGRWPIRTVLQMLGLQYEQSGPVR